MKLSVYVNGRDVAVLEPVGDFKSVLSYHAHVPEESLISLTMPVRTESYVWDDPLHPIFQMNLPEGYLLQVLQERFGPHIGANPTALLAIIGRHMVGRVQVATPESVLSLPVQPIDIATILQGDNSEQAFSALVRQYADSGISGVIPKFLDAQLVDLPVGLTAHNKASFITRQHIIKGSASHLPYVALNEHFCMQVAARVLPTARTEISQDGMALVVHRFDLDEQGHMYWAMEDFCALLGMRPAAKYETTWERIAKAVRDHVHGSQRQEVFRQLAAQLLLTYALRNADCHAKNLALLYTSRQDVHLSPVYDMLTTAVYEGYQHNPPAISFMGKKTWLPSKNLQRFLVACFGVSVQEQLMLIAQISDAVADVAVQVKQAMDTYPDFRETGKRMLMAWSEGVNGLRSSKVYAVGEWSAGQELTGFSAPVKRDTPKVVIGRSEGIGRR